jgi:hypothetical protein
VRLFDHLQIVRMVVMSITNFTMLILDWRLPSPVVPLLPLFVFVRHRYRNVSVVSRTRSARRWTVRAAC